MADILSMIQWNPNQLQEQWRPNHWQHIFLKPKGAKWINQMQKSLTSIHWAYKCDPEIIQIRCEPTKGLHTLIRTMATGSVDEKYNGMITPYLAILRANAAR